MSELDLPGLFAGVAADLEAQREQLNQADEHNHNHGDHMVEIFRSAALAAEQARRAGLAEAMDGAARQLRSLPDNGSAQVYARGLEILAAQLGQRGIELEDLIPYTRNYLKNNGDTDRGESGEPDIPPPAGSPGGAPGSKDVLKALLAALAEWEQVEANLATGNTGGEPGAKTGPAVKSSPAMDLGYLFGVGMAYMQAKQKGGDRLDVLSETVVSASPLGKIDYRHQSGVVAVRSLLEKLGQQ